MAWQRIDDSPVQALATGLLTAEGSDITAIMLQVDTTCVAMDDEAAMGVAEGILAILAMKRTGGVPVGLRGVDLDANQAAIEKATRKNRKALRLEPQG